jgi:hypothetical protein
MGVVPGCQKQCIKHWIWASAGGVLGRGMRPNLGPILRAPSGGLPNHPHRLHPPPYHSICTPSLAQAKRCLATIESMSMPARRCLPGLDLKRRHMPVTSEHYGNSNYAQHFRDWSILLGKSKIFKQAYNREFPTSVQSRTYPGL